jgi:hypothetical protein
MHVFLVNALQAHHDKFVIVAHLARPRAARLPRTIVSTISLAAHRADERISFQVLSYPDILHKQLVPVALLVALMALAEFVGVMIHPLMM